MSNSSIAILYFSRYAGFEAKEKLWFGRSSQKNKQLSAVLHRQSWKAIQATNLPVFHFHEGNQEGNNFGQRLANAYAELYKKGFEAVIAVGNDCPEIAKLNWHKIKMDLNAGKEVLGKSVRGGAYLLGITAKNFKKQEFENLPWQSNKLYVSLFEQLDHKENSIIELEVHRDINTFFDLKKFQLSESITSVFKRLISSLTQVITEFEFLISYFTFLIFKDAPLRAPPSK